MTQYGSLYLRPAVACELRAGAPAKRSTWRRAADLAVDVVCVSPMLTGTVVGTIAGVAAQLALTALVKLLS